MARHDPRDDGERTIFTGSVEDWTGVDCGAWE